MEESKKQDKDYTITFEIKVPESSKDSILNSIILLIRDFKQLQSDRVILDYEDYKQYNNDIIDCLHTQVSNLKVR